MDELRKALSPLQDSIDTTVIFSTDLISSLKKMSPGSRDDRGRGPGRFVLESELRLDPEAGRREPGQEKILVPPPLHELHVARQRDEVMREAEGLADAGGVRREAAGLASLASAGRGSSGSMVLGAASFAR